MKTMVAVILSLSLTAFADEAAAVKANNAFGFKLMVESVKAQKQPKNTVVSPLCAQFALSMALNGSSSTTREAFLNALSYDQSTSLDEINNQNKALLKGLVQPPLSKEDEAKLQSWEMRPPVLTLQNSAWVTAGKGKGETYEVKPSFEKTLKDFYDVDSIKSLDFKDPHSAEVINAWTKAATHDMIPEIIDANTLSQLLWVLLNTTFLEAKWQNAFGTPQDADFTLLDNHTKIRTPLMSRRGSFKYLSNNDVQIAEVAIAKSSLKAYVILPQKPETFASLGQSATGVWSEVFWKNTLGVINGQFSNTYGLLTMPTFAFDYGVTLKKNEPLTKNLGLNFLFQDTADFSTMDSPTSPPSKLGIIKQRSKIEWTQFGVKAAAAMMVGGMAKALAPVSRVTMVVDHPFYFAIYDSKTETFLFLGAVTDP